MFIHFLLLLETKSHHVALVDLERGYVQQAGLQLLADPSGVQLCKHSLILILNLAISLNMMVWVTAVTVGEITNTSVCLGKLAHFFIIRNHM